METLVQIAHAVYQYVERLQEIAKEELEETNK